MTHNEKAHSFLSTGRGLILAAIIVFILIGLTPPQDYRAQSIFLPAKLSRPAVPIEQVSLLPSAPTSHYKVLGLVHVMQHFVVSDAQRRVVEQDLINEARRLAAQAGANAVIVKSFGYTLPGLTPAAQAVYAFRGLAIFLPNKRAAS